MRGSGATGRYGENLIGHYIDGKPHENRGKSDPIITQGYIRLVIRYFNWLFLPPSLQDGIV